jgi:hypothetical protein
LDQEGFDRADPCFSDCFSFRRERRKALLSVTIMRLRSMVKSEAENIMEAETSRVVMVVRVFTAVRNWLGDSGFVAAVCKCTRQLRKSPQSYLSR